MNKLRFIKNFIFVSFQEKVGLVKKIFSSLNCAYSNGDLNENVLKIEKLLLNYLDKKIF